MKLNKIAATLLVAGVSLISSSAHALIGQDGWAFTGLTTTTSNIGHIGLNGGLATVNQQVNGSGDPYAGAKFTEYGGIFSLNYVVENCAGFCDSGFSLGFAEPLDGLQLVFAGLEGTVTAYDVGTGKLDYAFTAGKGTITLQGTNDESASWVNLATLVVASPSGGDLNNFFGQAQTQGQSTILAQFATFLSDFSIDLAGPGLGYVNPDELYLQAVTTNKISNPASSVGACEFDATLQCRVIKVTSDGSADLLRVPEPGSLALLGCGLLGLFGIRRRLG